MNIPPPKTKILLALLLLLCVSSTARAQGTDEYPANWCRSGLFPSDEAGFKPAKVGGNWTARAHFFSDDDDCPRYEVKCETKRYLVTGDQVLVSRTYGRWVCGWYQPRKGGEMVDSLYPGQPVSRVKRREIVVRRKRRSPRYASGTRPLIRTCRNTGW